MKTCYVHKDTRAIADLVRPGELHRGWCITRINVPREARGHGEGTQLLGEILADADADGVEIWLDVSPSDGLDWDQLIAWYGRHGFRERGHGVMMRRPIDT